MAHAVGRPSRPVVVARLYQRSNRSRPAEKKTPFVITGIHPGDGVRFGPRVAAAVAAPPEPASDAAVEPQEVAPVEPHVVAARGHAGRGRAHD